MARKKVRNKARNQPRSAVRNPGRDPANGYLGGDVDGDLSWRPPVRQLRSSCRTLMPLVHPGVYSRPEAALSRQTSAMRT